MATASPNLTEVEGSLDRGIKRIVQDAQGLSIAADAAESIVHRQTQS